MLSAGIYTRGRSLFSRNHVYGTFVRCAPKRVSETWCACMVQSAPQLLQSIGDLPKPYKVVYSSFSVVIRDIDHGVCVNQMHCRCLVLFAPITLKMKCVTCVWCQFYWTGNLIGSVWCSTWWVIPIPRSAGCCPIAFTNWGAHCNTQQQFKE